MGNPTKYNTIKKDNTEVAIDFDMKRYNKIKNDVDNYCILLNGRLEKTKFWQDIQPLENEDAERVFVELASGFCGMLEKLVSDYYDKEKKDEKKAMQRVLEDAKQKALEEVGIFFSILKQRVSDFSLSLGLILTEYERAQMITSENGKAVANVEAIKEICTIRIEGNAEQLTKFEKMARELHKSICAFDSYVRKLSGGVIGGIGTPIGHTQNMIEIYDGKIDLSFDRLKYIDLTKSNEPYEIQTERYIITGERKEAENE